MKKEFKKLITMILAVVLVIGMFPGAGMAKVNATTDTHSIHLFQVLSDWKLEDGITEGNAPRINLSLNTETADLAGEASYIDSVEGKWLLSAGNDSKYVTSFEAGKKYIYEITLKCKSGAAFQSWFDFDYNYSDNFQYSVNNGKCVNDFEDGGDWEINYNNSSGTDISLRSKEITAKAASSTPTLTPAVTLPDELQNATEAANGATLSYAKSGTAAYKVVLTADSSIQLKTSKGSYYDDALEMKIYDATGNVVETFTQERRQTSETTSKDYVYDSKALSAGTYYITITGTDSKNYSEGGKVALSINVTASNKTAEGAETIELSDQDGSTSVEFQQTRVSGNMVRSYYKLVVKAKTYYDFISSDNGITGKLYKGDKVSGDSMLVTSELNSNNNGKLLLDKGTYLLEVYGSREGNSYKVVINSKDFKDIKKINCQDSYDVYVGTTKIKLSYEPADFESSVSWSKGNENFYVDTYDINQKINLEPTEAIVYANALGEYTSTVTTSEGVSKTIKFMVKPRPTKVSYAEAETKSKKKASIKLEWSGDANWYKIYQKGSKDKDFKVVKETDASKITINTKPNQKFSYKIESCYKKDGKIVSSSMGDAVEAFTAPYKVATLKSVSQKGGTKYVKPYTKKFWHDATRTRAGYYETVKLGNQSNATVKVKFKKVGAKYYEANKGNPKAISEGTNTINYFKNNLSFTYKGKIGGKTEKIKIRGVWKKGVCTAYGPWSKTKKAKIKGNK